MQKLQSIITNYNVIQQGHFIFKNDIHSDFKIDKSKFLIVPELWDYFIGQIDLIAPTILPSTVDIIVSNNDVSQNFGIHLAKCMNKKHIVKTTKDSFYNTINNKHILIMYDIVNTGNDLDNLMWIIRRSGGKITGVLNLWNRSGFNIRSVNYYNSIINIILPSFFANKCKSCNMPLQDLSQTLIRRNYE